MSETISTTRTFEQQTLEKQQRLLNDLARLDSVLVAFSGGADSAYLAWAAHSVLGDRALSVTAVSPSFSAHDREQAAAFVRQIGLRHEFVSTSEFQNPLYVANHGHRWYHCTHELCTRMQARAGAAGAIAPWRAASSCRTCSMWRGARPRYQTWRRFHPRSRDGIPPPAQPAESRCGDSAAG